MVEASLREVEECREIGGLRFPAGIAARDLVVTGPPGSGKSTEVAALGGWPEEGFLDLTERRWWRSRVLRFRPREVHLGLPFQGHRGPLAVFDDAWLGASPHPLLNLSRIYLPPPGRSRRKIVFDFLLPPPEAVYEARSARSYRQTHPVDTGLSLSIVEAQLAAHWKIARHLHRAGLRVFVRDAYGGPPKRFSGEMQGGGSPWDASRNGVRRPLMVRMFEMLAGTSSAPILETLSELRLAGRGVRLPRELLPAEVILGPQRLRIYPELPVVGEAPASGDNVIVFDPDAFAEGIAGFVRLAPTERTRIGRGTEDRAVTARLPRDIPPRLDISWDGALLGLIDLHSPTGTLVRRVPDEERDLLRREARRALARLGEIVGRPVAPLAPREALALLEEVGDGGSRTRRPPDSRGRPGGLLELPIEVTPVVVGDLHARIDNLLTILSANRFLDGMESGRACMILLGDAVHPEDGELERMDTSILMMDVILLLMRAFPGGFAYLRGNHDSFSREVTKSGVLQGRAWEAALRETRGAAYVDALQRFYDGLPRIAASGDFVACHGGPPQESVSRERLIEIHEHPRLRHQLAWNRMQKPSNPGGYTKRDVRALKQALGVATDDSLIVAHTPEHDGNTVWLDYGGIRGHHIVHSADARRVAALTRIGGRIVPLVYPVAPCAEWLAGEPA